MSPVICVSFKTAMAAQLMDIKVRFNRTSWEDLLTTTDMLVWLMFGFFLASFFYIFAVTKPLS